MPIHLTFVNDDRDSLPSGKAQCLPHVGWAALAREYCGFTGARLVPSELMFTNALLGLCGDLSLCAGVQLAACNDVAGLASLARVRYRTKSGVFTVQ